MVSVGGPDAARRTQWQRSGADVERSPEQGPGEPVARPTEERSLSVGFFAPSTGRRLASRRGAGGGRTMPRWMRALLGLRPRVEPVVLYLPRVRETLAPRELLPEPP